MIRQCLRWGAVVAFACAACGCGAGGGRAPVPTADLAREALEKSLTAWKSGQRPGMISGAQPPIQAIDFTWQAGSKLQSFEILREEPSETERCFAVRLLHGNATAPEEARYRIVGNGPVFVYREEDYKRMLDMDNSPNPRATRRANR
jgi:hypothetical protein